MQTHHGSCHCGAIQYQITADITSAFECNCSHCARKGFLLAFMPKTQFALEQGEENLTEYRFNKKHIAHLFCKTCGVQCFGFGTDKEGKETVAINVRTLPDLDLTTLTITPIDGKNF